MKKIVCIFLLFCCAELELLAQEEMTAINSQIISYLPKNVKIIGLGDPTHQESTITKYRIDLIKKLVIELDYKIIAIEGNFFELYHAHLNFLKDGSFSHYEAAMYSMLNAEEMESLYDFVYKQNKSGNAIQIVGFDPSFSGSTYSSEVGEELNKTGLLSEKEQKAFLKQLKRAANTNISAIFRNNSRLLKKIVFTATQIIKNLDPKVPEEQFLWQAMNSLIGQYSGEAIPDKRDVGMVKNITFLQSTFPNQKIILFGSSTHLLKNPKNIETTFFQNSRETTLGNELNKAMGEQYYYIGYSAISGSKSNWNNQTKPLDEIISNSIEFQKSQQSNDASFFLNKHNTPINEISYSRFLGHSFVPLNLWKVMDGLVLIRDVEPFKIKTSKQ